MEGGAVIGGGSIGAIVGRAKGTDAERVTLSRLSVGGTLKVKGTGKSNHEPTGGVAGSVLNTDIEFSYNDGADVNGNSFVAGVVACLHNAKFEHSFNSATITGTGNNVGGVSAQSFPEGSTMTYTDANLFNLFNTGNASGKQTVAGILAFHQFGEIEGSINNSDNIKDAVSLQTGQISGLLQSKRTINTTVISSENSKTDKNGKNNYFLTSGTLDIVGKHAGSTISGGETGPDIGGGSGPAIGGFAKNNTELEGSKLVDKLNNGAGATAVNKIWLYNDGKVKLNPDYQTTVR